MARRTPHGSDWVSHRAAAQLRRWMSDASDDAVPPLASSPGGANEPSRRLGNRFEILAPLGAGGMGRVYRARDADTGADVAVKVARLRDPSSALRFEREVAALRRLDHPAVVRYLQHGVENDGTPWLATELVTGASLAARLQSGPLSIAGVRLLARALAEALAVVHAHGLVHRDLKPSNVILRDGRLEAATLLDLGLVRDADVSAAASADSSPGMFVGTPAYMSPEQVRGDADVDARSDVHSLGSVLFECLTGNPPFASETQVALLAGILLRDAPSVTAQRPDTPASMVRLLARMLAKERKHRPEDGAAVLRALDAIDSGGAGDTSAVMRAAGRLSASVLSAHEQRISTVILVEGGAERKLARLSARARGLGGSPSRLLDGSLVVAYGGPDQANVAAVAALELSRQAPGAAVAIGVGRGVTGTGPALGEAIDAAERALLRARSAGVLGVRLDQRSSETFEPRFEVGFDAGGAFLGAARLHSAPRLVLGRNTPCVGREAEMGMVRMLMRTAREEGAARAVLITGPAGIGKSRLRHEVLGELDADFEATGSDGVEVLLGAAAPVGTGSAFALLAQLVRRTALLREGESAATRVRKLRERLGRVMRGEPLERALLFLGDLAGVPVEETPALLAARHQPAVMGDQVRRAFCDFLAAELDHHPVLLVVEDLHWGDVPSVSVIHHALRTLAQRPLLVMLLGRPETTSAFPALCEDGAVMALRLGALGRVASETLLRAMLGDGAPPDALAHIASQAEGNPLHLEELVRSYVADGAHRPSRTLLALLEGRLSSLEPAARRLLRAASIYGETFWLGGVEALLDRGDSDETQRWLDVLTSRELVSAHAVTRFAGEREYSFRHGLLREAALGMLTERDAQLGHRLAAAWLERVGERDAVVLAEHLQRGGEPERAIACWVRAARRSLEGHDFTGAVERSRSARGLGARGRALGEALRVEAEAYAWLGRLVEARAAADEAMQLVEVGTSDWCFAAIAGALAASRSGDLERTRAVAAAVRAQLDDHAPSDDVFAVVGRLFHSLLLFAVYDEAIELLERADALMARRAPPRDDVMGRWHAAHAMRCKFDSDAAGYLLSQRAAYAAFLRAGDLRNAATQQLGVGWGLADLGLYDEAALEMEEAMRAASQLGLPDIVASVQAHLGWVRGRLGAFDEGVRLLDDALRYYDHSPLRRATAEARTFLAELHRGRGDVAAAEREARRAAELAAESPGQLCHALVQVSRALLARGETVEAANHAQRAVDALAVVGRTLDNDAGVHLALAEAFLQGGREGEAHRVLDRAKRDLERRVGRLDDPKWRERFLAIAEHARIVSLGTRLPQEGAQR